MKWIIGVLVSLVIATGIAIGGWDLHWWTAQSSVNHQNHINRSSYDFQTTINNQVQQLAVQAADIDVQLAAAAGDNATALKAQRAAITAQACSLYFQITSPTGDVHSFAAANCKGA